jgi:imidazolonepropionase
MPELVIDRIGMLATPTGFAAKSGAAQGEITILKNAWLAVDNGVITGVGEGQAPPGDKVFQRGRPAGNAGLVDAHTHLVFGGWRNTSWP